SVLYNDNVLRDALPVSVSAVNLPLRDFLDNIFNNQPLKYQIKNTSIFISKKAAESMAAGPPSAPDYLRSFLPVTGLVRDAKGRPLEGVNIVIKGTKRGTTTDHTGHFSINAPEGSVLVISGVGYETQEVKLTSASVLVSLNISQTELDETQVIAYGTESKRFSIGAVSTVSAGDIARQPVSNPLLALQGRAPGLAVNGTNGVPGSTALVQVRGQNTLGSTLQVKPYDQPLFIIDGVPFAPQNVNINLINNLATASSYTGGISQATGISPFNSINPHDIES